MHNRKLNRLKNFDYSNTGAYFVTLCTQNMENYFGVIKDGEKVLNKFGKLTEKYWKEIPKHYDNIGIDEYVIMPNHLHSIIMIFEPMSKTTDSEHCSIQSNTVGTEQCSVPKNTMSPDTKSKNYGILSKIIKSFKDITTKEIRHLLKNPDFKWQRSYYDRIIRNENELNKIREYIYYNPINFEYRKDKIFEENSFNYI